MRVATERHHRSVTTAGGEAWGVVLSAGLGGVGGGVFFDAAAATVDGDMILGLGATAGFGRAPPPPFVRLARGDGAGWDLRRKEIKLISTRWFNDTDNSAEWDPENYFEPIAY